MPNSFEEAKSLQEMTKKSKIFEIAQLENYHLYYNLNNNGIYLVIMGAEIYCFYLIFQYKVSLQSCRTRVEHNFQLRNL